MSKRSHDHTREPAEHREKARRERIPVVWVQHSDEQLAKRTAGTVEARDVDFGGTS
jgi:hypothetical protein